MKYFAIKYKTNKFGGNDIKTAFISRETAEDAIAFIKEDLRGYEPEIVGTPQECTMTEEEYNS